MNPDPQMFSKDGPVRTKRDMIDTFRRNQTVTIRPVTWKTRIKITISILFRGEYTFSPD
jgi:hypothetical protein